VYNQNNSETTLDKNFIDTINVLNNNNIFYWVCHGSLLGFIRDGNLIPWDHDIDIAVWDNQSNKKNIIDIFTSAGFIYKDDDSRGSLHFVKSKGRDVDINFYKDVESINGNEPLVGVLWKMPKSKMGSLLDMIINNKDYNGKNKLLFSILSYFKIAIFPIYYILNKLNLIYVMKGYTTPKSLLDEFSYKSFFDLQCRLPAKANSVLRYIYGEDWSKPNQGYNWTIDSSSVLTNEK